MLVEIQCDKFRQKKITFHSGLNVVLGDEVATNSIGKSTLLMVIDFIFGGDSFLEHNNDAVLELDHHEYLFSLKFTSGQKYFKRGTSKPDLIYICDEKYSEESFCTVSEYKALLKKLYELEDIDLTFRSIVSLISRVWGKHNLDVKQPLHNHKSQKSSECIEHILKIYNKYGTISTLSSELKRKNEEKKAYKGAFDEGIISRISKSEYKDRLNKITEIDTEIADIKKNLAQFSVNISEIINRSTLELKNKKDRLLFEKTNVQSRLNRVERNVLENKHIKSKNYKKLIELFPDINIERLSTVEEFHSDISKILRSELLESKKELADQLDAINSELEDVNIEIDSLLDNVDSPGIIIDRVHTLSKNYTGTKNQIEYYEADIKIKKNAKDAKHELEIEKIRVLKLLQDLINDKLEKYVLKVYGKDRRSPTIFFKQNSYTFEAVEDKGTGKAYSNLILLDLTLMETTKMPFLIHDSLLFKNIENEAVAKTVSLYETFGKQVFIAIDEISKYGKETENLLKKNKVIQLSDEEMLYIKDWRS